MSLAVLISRSLAGVRALPVTVETHLSGGMPRVNIVGLPDTEVREAGERVRAAIMNSNFEFPARRVTINLAPADLPKEGSRFDLPMALGILAAAGQIPKSALANCEFVGELALGGQLRPVSGMLPIALAAAKSGRTLFAPAGNAAVCALAADAETYCAPDLLAVCAHLTGKTPLARRTQKPPPAVNGNYECFSEVKGQSATKRALEVAAAGGHSALMQGPPGGGKSMLAMRFPGLMPPLEEHEAIDSASVLSLTGRRFDIEATWRRRPFRAPHHSCSPAALVGGGTNPRPGEISLAHRGVLFLDELPEFDRAALETLREPLESGEITISRAARQARFPARFQLLAAMNPCPCGYRGHPDRPCRCGASQIARYRGRISGPFLDRIDIQIETPALAHAEMIKLSTGETSAQIRARVSDARDFQRARQNKLNAHLGAGEIDRFCAVSDALAEKILSTMRQLNLSARGYHRVLKVARTIADLAQSEEIEFAHLREGLVFRRPPP